MAKLSERQVRRVAQLSHLELTANEIKSLQAELSAVVDYFSALTELDTEGIEPMGHPAELTDVLAEDDQKHEQSLTAKTATGATDNIYNDYFVVPQLIDKESS